ncbi:MAG: hybrid sensor histidine kinase/response regulator [Deltaproteobacteria bacterium RIFOXYD12_FULL_57_12]|nr:MAG: hybrid sensor histidine kinase/response regulator [Deltaproteobacteria bacterium RIFOXYD12_FULL_57_12]
MTSGNGADLSDMSMLDLFRMEAENHCATLTDDLLALEQEPTAADRLESLMRAAHSIKGAARIVGLDGAVRVAHAMEDVFVAAQTGKVHLNKDGIDLLLKGVDLLIGIAKLPADEVPAWLAAQAGVIDGLTHDFTALARQEKPKTKPTAPAPAKEEKPAPPEPVPIVQPVTDSAPPSPAAAQKNPGRRSEDKEGSRAIRISTENMNRLMGLAGEVLIESRWMPSFSSELMRLKMKQDELLRVLDKMNLEVDERLGLTQNYIAELHKKINNCRFMLAEKLGVLEDHSRHSTEISHRLYHELIASRMRPFSEGIAGFPRMVRDLARELDKEIRLEIVGEDTRVDRDIMEKIEAPLNHLIRNAIDHGIESPDEREKAGKPREAVLRLEARHRAGMLNVLVAEDGRGIDVEKIREAVVSKNMITKEVAADLNEAELMEFLFLPNFSTKKTVSKVSGRGVGLDVVHSVVSEVRGVVRASSKLHKGTSFELQLPITLSVMRALLIEIHNEPYAFPLVAIDHVLKIPKEMVKTVEGRRYFTYNDKRIGLVHAQQVLGKPAINLPDDEEMSVAVFSDRLHQYGLIVNRFWGVRDLVVQPLNPHLGKTKDISAAAILEDGTPVLIVDVEDMVRSMDLLISGDRLRRFTSSQSEKTTSEKTVKRILVVDDSITVREVERKMLTAKDYEVDVAVDGMDAWNTLRRGTYDLVITDVDMPRMDGIELVTLIKQDQKLQSTPVIIVSYKDREEDKNRGLEAGADYYLTKGSFHDQTLVKAVRDLIGQANN